MYRQANTLKSLKGYKLTMSAIKELPQGITSSILKSGGGKKNAVKHYLRTLSTPPLEKSQPVS